ncbi:MAG: NAD(P)H-quinone oxidoreductase [Thermoanaerobaculia bacterium]
MRAVLPVGKEGVPELGEAPEPSLGPDEVLIQVAAAGLNRADLLQLRGLYPPPQGESPIPGLECAGVVAAVGEEVTDWSVGQRVMALLAGGGQAERVSAPAGQCMAIPARLSLLEAACLPEVALTAWTNLVAEGGVEAGETVLITGAASGVGTFAVQLARELGARVFAAGRSLARLEALRPLGASACFELSEHLGRELRSANGGRGADLVLDLVGGGWLASVLAALEPRGRLVLVGLMAGARAELDLGLILARRLRVQGSVLRPRSRAEKARLVGQFLRFGASRLDDGRLHPQLDRAFAFDQAALAYGYLEASAGVGKVVLAVDPQLTAS